VPFVYAVQRTEDFDEWLAGLRDPVGKARILARIDSARFGNLGDCRSVGDKVSEMRVNIGPGYRVYYTLRRRVVVILLCGGVKGTQARDIARAERMARELE